MPVDLTNPAVIKVLKEAYENEKRIRVQWIEKNSEKMKKAVTLERELKNHYVEDVIKHNMVNVLPVITREHVNAAVNRRKRVGREHLPGVKNILHDHSLIKIGLGDAKEDPRLSRPDTDFSPDPIMRPIDPSTKRLLFKPNRGFGREQYLTERYKLMPEQRFYLPVCSNWDYGWRTKDSKMVNPRQYARSLLLQRTLKNRVGPQPDPFYYKVPTVAAFSKCIDY